MSTTLILDFRWIEGIRHFSSAFLSLLSAIFVLYYIRSLRAMVSDHRERMSVIFDRGDEERLKKEKVDMEVKSASRRHGADDEVTKEVTKVYNHLRLLLILIETFASEISLSCQG